MFVGYIVVPVNNSSGLRATPVMAGSASQTSPNLLYKSDVEISEEIEELPAFAAAMAATGEGAEVIRFDQAIREIENGRR
jgi:hypothetical protein